MSYDEFYKLLNENLNEIDLQSDNIKAQKLYNYMKLLIEWNNKINLTSITDPKEIILKHFVDSLTINKYIRNTSKVLDLGTGAGLPGIPNAIFEESTMFTLLDSLNKRIKFLQLIKEELKIENINPIHNRAEDLGNDINYREKYDVVFSRAVAPMNVLLEYMMPFVNVGGICICMKGPNFENEIKDSKVVKILGGTIQEIANIKIGNNEIQRNLIIIKKECKTPIKYPRKAGIPAKSPIE